MEPPSISLRRASHSHPAPRPPPPHWGRTCPPTPLPPPQPPGSLNLPLAQPLARRDILRDPSALAELGQRLAGGVLAAGLVVELGYACASSRESFKHVLRLVHHFDEAALAQLLSAVARTHTGLPDSSATFARRAPRPRREHEARVLLAHARNVRK